MESYFASIHESLRGRGLLQGAGEMFLGLREVGLRIISMSLDGFLD